MGFRFELIRLFIGVGLAAIPVAVFGDDGLVGAIVGCVAGVALIVLSLTFQPKHIRPVGIILTCQVISSFLCMWFAPMGGFILPYDVMFFEPLFFGALVGGLWGFFANACERQDARATRARIEAWETPAGESTEDASRQCKDLCE